MENLFLSMWAWQLTKDISDEIGADKNESVDAIKWNMSGLEDLHNLINQYFPNETYVQKPGYKTLHG